jgi:hypothetical protein
MLKSILNRKHALTNLTDAEFEALLPQLAAELEANGVLRETYADADIQKDWALLLKKDVTVNAMTISATEVAGMKVLRKHMQHFHAVRNYKGHSVESLWTQPCLEKALRFNRAQHSTPYASEIIRSLSFANGLGKVTMYRPLMAKKVVAYLATKDAMTDVRVLDVCAGWGGRMIGAKSVESPSFAGVSPSVAGGLRGELVSPSFCAFGADHSAAPSRAHVQHTHVRQSVLGGQIGHHLFRHERAIHGDLAQPVGKRQRANDFGRIRRGMLSPVES